MTRAGPLEWRTGAGWLVLAGDGRRGTTGWDSVDAVILGWAIPGRPAAIVLTAGSSSAIAEDLLEEWVDLGGATGYVVPIYSAADARRIENCELLAEAGLIYLAGGPNILALVRVLAGSPALDAVALAFEDGAPVVGAGLAASAMGSWVANPNSHSQEEPGWDWVRGVIIAPRFVGTERAQHLRRQLENHPECLGLGIPRGAALALGPEGRVETLGTGQPTVVLGRGVAQ